MWWALVTDDNAVSLRSLALAFALHQHRNPTGQNVNLALLAGDDVAQLIRGTCQMGDFFFQVFHGHRTYIHNTTEPSGLSEKLL